MSKTKKQQTEKEKLSLEIVYCHFDFLRFLSVLPHECQDVLNTTLTWVIPIASSQTLPLFINTKYL